MLDLITGTPGAGKTLLAVHEVYQSVQAGRAVYARVDGLTVPGVQELVGSWRDCPDGALIVVDECQELFGAGDRAKVSEEDIYALERHRHRGLDLILITQDPRLLAGHVVRLVGRHRHLVRVMGSKQVRMYTMDSCADRLSKADLRSAVMTLWRHPPYVFGWYKSASKHTRVVKPPRLIWGALGAAVFGLAWAWYSLTAFFSGESAVAAETVTASAVAAVSGPPLVASGSSGPKPGYPDKALVQSARAVLDTVQGCVATADMCRCWDREHQDVDLKPGECRRVARAPIRTSAARDAIAAAQARRAGRADEERGSPAAKPAPDWIAQVLPGGNGAQGGTSTAGGVQGVQ